MGLFSKARNIDDLLKSIVKESIDVAMSTSLDDEKEKQADLSRRLKGTSGISSYKMLVDEEEASEKPEESSKDDKDKEEKIDINIPSEIKFQDIRKMIDQVRSGRSLKDPETKLELVDYYDNLDEPDRIALYKFLTSISAILTRDVDGDALPTPDQGKGKVNMSSKSKVTAPDPNKKKIAKSAKKVQSKENQKKKSRPTSPGKEFDAPIKVGESQDKNEVIVEMSRLVI
ncbi:hypothetical protein OAA09_00585 [bacterium]|nr:hypothetical protein [bacterium]